MKATPAKKNSRSTISAAATRLRKKPVSEIALGVSRDSISRSRISSCVVGTLPRGRERRGLGCRGRTGVAGSAIALCRRLAERPGVRSGPGQQLLGRHGGDGGGEAAQEHI